MLHGKFQANFHRRGAVIGKKEMREFAWNPFAKPYDQLFGGIVREAGKDDLFQFSSLLGDGGSDARIRVAVKIHPP